MQYNVLEARNQLSKLIEEEIRWAKSGWRDELDDD